MTFPNPLTPADCDLRDFEYMPLAVQTLFQSDFWLVATSDEKVAAIELWGRSWHQVPAGSMPSDERLLAALSGARSGWPGVREAVLRGWIECVDGRLYHPTVCEKALEAWLEKLAQRLSSGAGNSKRWGVAFDAAPIESQIALARQMLSDLNPMSRALTKRKTLAKPDAPVPTGSGQDSDHDPNVIRSGSQGKGREGKGVDIGGKPPITPPDAASASSDDLGDATSNAGGDEAAAGQSGLEGIAAPGEPIQSAEAAKPGAKAAKSIDLPDWVPAKEWAEFVAMRKAMGRAIPFTEAAARGIVRKLTQLRDGGQDPANVLEQSTRNGWRDVFALKAPNPSARTFSTRQTAADRRADTIAGLTGRRTHPHSNQGDRHDHIDVDARVVG